MSGVLSRTAGLGIGGVAGFLTGSELVDLYRSTTAAAGVTNQNIVFPTDLIDTNEERSAYCNLRFSRYVRRSIREAPRLNIESAIKLPLPANLREAQSVTYSKENLGPMIGAAADAVAGASRGTTITGSAGEVAARIAGNLGIGAAAEAYSRASLPFAEQARGAVSSLSGITVNPFQTVLFKAPNFKSHTFNWKFIPRNAAESDLIRNIIELFKYHSSPGLSGSGVFFSYPEILEIKLYPEDLYLYRFKPCVVESVTVNYAPNGPSIYRSTGAPAAVEVSLSIQEIEYWTKNDYGQLRAVTP